jgi:hypothetical protein
MAAVRSNATVRLRAIEIMSFLLDQTWQDRHIYSRKAAKTQREKEGRRKRDER